MRLVILLLLFVELLYATELKTKQLNTREMMDNSENTICLLNRSITLNMNDTLQIEDSLFVTLTQFSHKHPIKGGTEKATAHITLIKNGVENNELISMYGIEGKSPENDGLTDEERYDTLFWDNYLIQLEKLNYDSSITITIKRCTYTK